MNFNISIFTYLHAKDRQAHCENDGVAVVELGNLHPLVAGNVTPCVYIVYCW